MKKKVLCVLVAVMMLAMGAVYADVPPESHVMYGRVVALKTIDHGSSDHHLVLTLAGDNGIIFEVQLHHTQVVGLPGSHVRMEYRQALDSDKHPIVCPITHQMNWVVTDVRLIGSQSSPCAEEAR